MAPPAPHRTLAGRGRRLAPWRPEGPERPGQAEGSTSVPRDGRPASGRSPQRSSAAGLALILVVAFMVVLDFSIVNVALASIERELHASATGVQWVITAYAITFGGLLVLGGRIGDLFGRRRMFIAGLVLFSMASLAGGLASSIGVLVAARALQGVGAALVAPAALSLITTNTEEGPPRHRALGLYGATASIGFVAGLVLGGVLVQYFDWRAVLWVNVPIGLVAALLAPAWINEAPRGTARSRLDVGGAVLVTGAIAALVYGVSEIPASGWTSGRSLGLLGLAAALGAAFVAVERRHPAPLVRLGLLRRRGLRAANVMTLLMGAWSAAELLTVPLYLQLVLHDSPLVAGLAMAPQGVIGFVGAARGARIVGRIGLRALLVTAGVTAGLGLLLLGLFFASRDYWYLLPGLLLTGYGSATGAFGTTVAATQGVDRSEQGLAGGLVNMSRQVGAAVGVAVTAALLASGEASGASISHDRTSLLVIAALGLLAAAVAARGTGYVRGDRSVRNAGEVHVGSSLPDARTANRRTAPRRPYRLDALVLRGYRSTLCRVHRAREGAGAAPGAGATAGAEARAPVHAQVHVQVPESAGAGARRRGLTATGGLTAAGGHTAPPQRLIA